MRNIIIVEAVSTGYNLVEDVRRRGYNPIVMESYGEVSEDIAALRNGSDSLYYSRPEIIRACEKYEDTLSLAKKYDPLLVVAGSEQGVGLATMLASDLGLLGNPIEMLEAMTKKDAMHEALRKAGIRYIRGKVVSNSTEALAFLEENDFERAVVKPIQSAGSQGLFLCNNREEVKSAVDTLLTYKDFYGRPITSVLVQEMIVVVILELIQKEK